MVTQIDKIRQLLDELEEQGVGGLRAVKRRTSGTAILQAISKHEDKCDKRTIKLLPKMGKKAPLCYEYVARMILHAELIGTCAYGCPGNSEEAHAVWYLVGRASSFARAVLRLTRMGFYDEALIVVRSLGEITNLFMLFVTAPTSVDEWKKSNRAHRLDKLSPSKIRKRIEALGKTPPISAARYAALCEISTHPVPKSGPQKFNHAGRSIAGGVLVQEFGILVVLNELAEALSWLVILAARVCNVPAESYKRIREVCVASLVSVGKVNLNNVRQALQETAPL